MTIRSARRRGGFTLLEVLLGLAVCGGILALGVPQMTLWLLANKSRAAGEFYAEGFKLARQQALAHNAASRIVLTQNAGNGQMDWQIDLCFPTPLLPCNSASGNWSSPSAAASNDPEGASGFASVLRVAGSLPQADVLAPTLSPSGSSAIYFTALGWVDTGFEERLTRLQLDPTPAYAGQLHATALVVSLAGTSTMCDPDPRLSATDSRACPP